MTKLAVLAALGVAAAQQEHGDHTHEAHQEHQEPTYFTIFDAIAEENGYVEPKCKIDPKTQMSDFEFFRTLASGVYKSSAKGWYHSEQDVVSDDCLGDWMVPMGKQLTDFKLQLQYDPMATTIEDAHLAANNFVDLHYRNRDSCKVGKMYDDYYNWCLDNLEMCVGEDSGFYTRLYDNGYQMFGAFYDLAGIMMFENDECYTDAQNIDEVSRIIEDISALLSYVMGFDLDFDVERQQKHIRKSEFWTEVSEYWDSIYAQYFVEEWVVYPVYSIDDMIYIDDYMPQTPSYDDYLNYQIDMPDYSWAVPQAPEVPEMPEIPKIPEFPGLFDNLPPFPEIPPRPKFRDFMLF